MTLLCSMGCVRPSPSHRKQIRIMADRRLGVGCDQLLMVEPASSASADFRYRIWNADGGEVEHCGNGIRCVARFIHERGLSDATHLTFQTQRGLTRTERLADGQIRVDMGAPILAPANIPFLADTQATQYPLKVADTTWQIAAVSMGNPHAILRVEILTKHQSTRSGHVSNNTLIFQNALMWALCKLWIVTTFGCVFLNEPWGKHPPAAQALVQRWLPAFLTAGQTPRSKLAYREGS